MIFTILGLSPQAMQKLDTAEAELSRLRGDLQARPGMEGPGLAKSLGRYTNC
jgi:hypothetical protein